MHRRTQNRLLLPASRQQGDRPREEAHNSATAKSWELGLVAPFTQLSGFFFLISCEKEALGLLFSALLEAQEAIPVDEENAVPRI